MDDGRITNVLRARIYCGTPFYCVHAAVSDAPIRSGGALKLRTTLKRQTRQKSMCRPFSFIRGERWLWPGKTGSQLRGHWFPYRLGTIGDVRHPPGGICKTRKARYLTPGSPHNARSRRNNELICRTCTDRIYAVVRTYSHLRSNYCGLQQVPKTQLSPLLQAAGRVCTERRTATSWAWPCSRKRESVAV